MQCIRCTGMTVPEIIADGGLRRVARRCVQCGDILDQVIARNRVRRHHTQPRRPRTPVYGNDRLKCIGLFSFRN